MKIEVATTSLIHPQRRKAISLSHLRAVFLKPSPIVLLHRYVLQRQNLICSASTPVSGKTIYVECKAHRESLSSNCLTNLLGTVTLKDYEEGWLISTASLGKDAKGFLVEWEKKSQTLSAPNCRFIP